MDKKAGELEDVDVLMKKILINTTKGLTRPEIAALAFAQVKLARQIYNRKDTIDGRLCEAQLLLKAAARPAVTR